MLETETNQLPPRKYNIMPLLFYQKCLVL